MADRERPTHGNRLPLNPNISDRYSARSRGEHRRSSNDTVGRDFPQTRDDFHLSEEHGQLEQQREISPEHRTTSDTTILYLRSGQSDNPDSIVCNHCGDSVKDSTDVYRDDNKVYHRHCLEVHIPRLKEALDAFSVKAERQKDKRGKRDSILTELLQKASALHNSNSGFLLIHLIGLLPGDNFTGAFDEFVDVKLQGLINDGSLFDDVYKKSRLSDHSSHKLKKFHDILVLYVEYLITSDFKAKLALDDCIVDIPDQTLLRFIKDGRISEKRFHEISANNPEDLCHLQESRHIQVKAYFQPKERDDGLVPNIFNKLRAAEYISAFTKNKDGGSYLVGLQEKTDDLELYQSKVLCVKPVVIDDCDLVKQQLLDRVSSTCLVCDYNGNVESSDDIVKINFIPTTSHSPRDQDGYVVHMSVRSVDGVVFYDKNGPESYRVNDENSHCLTRLTVSEWFHAFRQRLDQGR